LGATLAAPEPPAPRLGGGWLPGRRDLERRDGERGEHDGPLRYRKRLRFGPLGPTTNGYRVDIQTLGRPRLLDRGHCRCADGVALVRRCHCGGHRWISRAGRRWRRHGRRGTDLGRLVGLGRG